MIALLASQNSQHLRTLRLDGIRVGERKTAAVETLLAKILQASPELTYLRLSLSDALCPTRLDKPFSGQFLKLRVLHLTCDTFDIRRFEERFPVLEEFKLVGYAVGYGFGQNLSFHVASLLSVGTKRKRSTHLPMRIGPGLQ